MKNRKENRITLPQHLRARAQQRVEELGYGSLLEYVSELVVCDTSPLIARGLAAVPQQPPATETATAPPPVVPVSGADGWGGEI